MGEIMRYAKVKGHYAYQHKGNRLEVVEPGSVVPMRDDMIDSFLARGMGEECEGPEHLIRPSSSPEVERPGLDPRPSRAERAVAPAQQRAGAI